jgi:CitB family two-component system response regulator CitT
MKTEVGVLIIEDDFRVAQINQQFVETVDGFKVIALAHTRAQAIEILSAQSEAIQLVLLDAYLPDVEGLGLLWQLRQDWSNLDIVMVTAAQEVETIQEALRGGVFDYLIKPIMADRVEQTLKRYQHARRLMAHNDTLDQASLDAALRNDPVVITKARLPKNIDERTLDKIRQCLKQFDTGVSATTLGTHIGVSRSTARRYLEYLVALQEISAELVYGDVGRPERHYCVITQT